MHLLCKKVKESQSVHSVEHEIANLKEVFSLVNEDELEVARKRYYHAG
jgi:hypothetical protein